ncbi:MAG: lipopolysaccharide biosynthesis protein [Nitrospira sp.]
MAAASTDSRVPFSRRELDRTLFHGLAWTAVGRWLAQAISWLATLYVARILSPGDYGLVAMATVPIGLARLIEGLGLDAILLQDRSLSTGELRRLAGAAVCLGTVLTATYVAISVPIALYFQEPQVATIVSVLSLTFILDALQILPRALLQRDLRFRALAWINGWQVVVAAGTMVLAAQAGWTYWALVVNTLIGSSVITVVLFVWEPVMPAWPREISAMTSSMMSGWHMLVSRFAYYGYSSADSAIIGRLLGKDALGIFGFAMTFASLPVREITSLMSGVVPGIFTAIQTDTKELRRYFLLLTETVSYLTLPASLGLALTADDFVPLALGETWNGVIVPLQILSLYMAIFSCQDLLAHVLLWTGRFALNMWLSIFALAVLPVCFYIGAQYGLPGVAVGWLVGFPLSVAPAFVYVSRILDCSWGDYWRAFKPALIGCVAMLSAVTAIKLLLPDSWHHGLRLGIQSSAGAAVYGAVMMGGFGTRVRALYRIVVGANDPSGPDTNAACARPPGHQAPPP